MSNTLNLRNARRRLFEREIEKMLAAEDASCNCDHCRDFSVRVESREYNPFTVQ